jgi:hypothetical protein
MRSVAQNLYGIFQGGYFRQVKSLSKNCIFYWDSGEKP